MKRQDSVKARLLSLSNLFVYNHLCFWGVVRHPSGTAGAGFLAYQ